MQRNCLAPFVVVIAAVISCVPATRVRAADPFSENVRSTDPQTPDQEQRSFHLPPGFEIQLVAAEPDIAKPINLAFDAAGRLWVTNSREYPFAAPPGKGRDSIKVLEDFSPDGRARKITTFADALNIPIGLYPFRDGVIGYSIPRISFYREKTVEPWIGDFGYDKDTHGMASNFRRGFDGWVYGCHGFNNSSTVKALDGAALTMHSGNTYRFSVDGQRIEQFTWGQTNPFGLCFDPMGNLYSSDSHSKPNYQLLRGGYYEGIGKTDDGLGFAPAMMQHLHGSTGIGGICFYAAENFPPEFRGNTFVGNVVTSRINRDSITYRGSSPAAHEEADFLSTDDPWFRPVNIVLGPDGAIYVADFYNRIIGHYEVKLNHPGRDRERGRIWRIAYKGSGSNAANSVKRDLATANVDELIAALSDPNLAVRMLAMDQLSDRIGADAVKPLRRFLVTTLTQPPPTVIDVAQPPPAVSDVAQPPSAVSRVHALWTLYRLNALNHELLANACKQDATIVRVHAMRILAEIREWDEPKFKLAIAGLRDADPLVQRCAADALGQHPRTANIPPLLALRQRVDPSDTHLLYVARMALRNQLKSPGAFAALDSEKLSDPDLRAIADVALAAALPEAGDFLARHVEKLADDPALLTRAITHAARYASTANLSPLIATIRARFADNTELQLDLLESICQGAGEKDAALPEAARNWAETLATQTLRPSPGAGVSPGAGATAHTWTCLALDGSRPTIIPWSYEMRRSTGGQKAAPFLSSLPGSEQATGILRSPTFSLPSTLSFFVAGHNGYPGTDPPMRNLVRVRDAATGTTLAQAPPPRNDVARRVTFDLHDHAGKQGYLEVVDGDDGNAYAWIAIARLEPAVIALPQPSPMALLHRVKIATQVAARFKLTALSPDLAHIASAGDLDAETRLAAATALLTLNEESAIPPIASLLENPALPTTLREQAAAALSTAQSAPAVDALIAAFRTAPRGLQLSLARALASTAPGAARLLDAVAQGKASAELLLEPTVRDRLAAANIPKLDDRIKELTRGIAAPKAELMKLIAQRRRALDIASSSPQAGAQVFAKNCVICHQIAGKGGLVGPQLAGLARRGIDRVLEDILDPNRNVDPAFRYSTLMLKSGQVITALQKRDAGTTLVFTDSTGKEITIEKSQIRKRIESTASLMPSNFAEILSQDDLNHLVAYLMAN